MGWAPPPIQSRFILFSVVETPEMTDLLRRHKWVELSESTK